jgi:hypothetical protein
VFACATANLGPRVVCFPHLDSANLPHGWCAVTALGQFDHEKGGHLVLEECKLILEIPPGATYLIPSACITHYNAAVAKHETRFSFTQYTAGSIFRWVDHQFMNEAEFWSSLKEEEYLLEVEKQNNRLKNRLKLLRKWK